VWPPGNSTALTFGLTVRRPAAVHTLNYRHGQLQVHTLNYREPVQCQEQEFMISTSRKERWDRLAVGSPGSLMGAAPLNRHELTSTGARCSHRNDSLYSGDQLSPGRSGRACASMASRVQRRRASQGRTWCSSSPARPLAA
jgi:hypothetical protein